MTNPININNIIKQYLTQIIIYNALQKKTIFVFNNLSIVILPSPQFSWTELISKLLISNYWWSSVRIVHSLLPIVLLISAQFSSSYVVARAELSGYQKQDWCHRHLSSCLLPTDSLISRIWAMSIPPPLLSGQLRQLIKNIHVARTPLVRTALTHTCCQGQSSGLSVRPDAARWIDATVLSLHAQQGREISCKVRTTC